MEYIAATKRIAVVVLKAMPTRMNLAKDVMSDPDALIAEVAICNTVCMHYSYMTKFQIPCVIKIFRKLILILNVVPKLYLHTVHNMLGYASLLLMLIIYVWFKMAIFLSSMWLLFLLLCRKMPFTYWPHTISSVLGIF